MSALTYRVALGDVREQLRAMPEASAQCVVTSPPYWGLRDYGVAGQLGLEATPAEFVAAMVEVFREVRRVLKPDGTLWLNLGDSYITRANGGVGDNSTLNGSRHAATEFRRANALRKKGVIREEGLKHKDLVGIPWRVAFALQGDGWWLRSENIWAKANPMPESVTDRPTKSHEHVFLLTRSERYFYDSASVREPDSGAAAGNGFAGRQGGSARVGQLTGGAGTREPWTPGGGRNLRTVWTLPTQPFPGAHFATFPEALVRPCILAGTRAGDVVLDPFSGSGTTGVVALKLGRSYVGVELNPEYRAMSLRRLAVVAPLLAREAGEGVAA